MTSKQGPRSGPSDGEEKSRRHKFKDMFRHKKDTTLTQLGSQMAQPDEGSKNRLESFQSPKLEPPRGSSFDRQGSTFAISPERRPPPTQHGYSNDVVATGDAKKSEDLWVPAYEALKLRDPDLVAAYERHLVPARAHSADPSPSPELIETIVKSNLQDREASQWVIKLGKQPVKVREVGEKVITFILWSNDIVSQALSAQPYAALAWSGISILLPLLLNSSQQSYAMIEGLNSISDLLRLYKIRETVYLQVADKPAHPNFVQAVVELYSNIFEYQARLICHLSQSSLQRGIRGTLELNNWGDMLKKVQTSDSNCTKYCKLDSIIKERQHYEEESSRMLESVDIQKRVLEMWEMSQAQRCQDRQDDQEAELLQTLASDYKSDKDSIFLRVPGTCEWFFEDDRFLEWRDSKDSRLLWVSAGPGCGKSVLSRSLIDERRVCTNAMTSTVCYFFFKDGQEQRMRGANALSAVLHQLFVNTALISYALPSAKNYGKKLRDAFSELWGILIKCAQDPEAGEIICILDALDECEKDARSQLLEKLVSFFSPKEAHKSPSSKLKFLVTSRPYDDLEEKFEPLSDVSTYLHFDGNDKSQRIGQDINLVIDHEIPRIAGRFSDGDRKRISEHLKEMNNRTYLWLYLIVRIITDSRSKYSKASNIDSLLSDLPSEVSGAYETILSRSSDKVQARILLQLIVAATRPLSLEEANMALTIATCGEDCRSQSALELWPLQSFPSTVQNMCGLFVSVHDGKLSLIHQTARAFLVETSKSTGTHPHKWEGCLDMAIAHGIISRICLNYLNFQDFASTHQNQLDQGGHAEPKFHQHLLNYAAQNWATHYTSQPDELAKNSQNAAKVLCNTSLPQLRYWFPLYCDSRYIKSSSWTDLGIASLLGLTYVVEGFLIEGVDINTQGRKHSTAL